MASGTCLLGYYPARYVYIHRLAGEFRAIRSPATASEPTICIKTPRPVCRKPEAFLCHSKDARGRGKCVIPVRKSKRRGYWAIGKSPLPVVRIISGRAGSAVCAGERRRIFSGESGYDCDSGSLGELFKGDTLQFCQAEQLRKYFKGRWVLSLI